jgi:DNA polymerase III delta prime subunit
MVNNYTTLLNPECSYFYNDILNFFSNIKSNNDIPNIIFYGSPNPLKYILVNTCLELLTDIGIHNINNVVYKINTSTNKQIDKIIKQSDYHIIINPSGNNSDRYIVQNIIKDFARNTVLDVFNVKYKIVLINNAHNLSHVAQASLRRTMEQYNYNCRFFMICDKPLLQPLESRCYHIRVPLPSNKQFAKFLFDISLKNNVIIPIKQLLPIVIQSNKNFNTLLWYVLYQKYKLGDHFVNDFDVNLNKIYDLIIEKDITNINKCLNIYYSCIITGITISDLIKQIVLLFISKSLYSLTIIHKIVKKSIECCALLYKCRRNHSVFRKFIIDVMIIVYKEDF